MLLQSFNPKPLPAPQQLESKIPKTATTGPSLVDLKTLNPKRYILNPKPMPLNTAKSHPFFFFGIVGSGIVLNAGLLGSIQLKLEPLRRNLKPGQRTQKSWSLGLA